MADGAAVVFARLIFKSDDFRPFDLANQFCMDDTLGKMGESYMRLCAIIEKQYFVEPDLFVSANELHIDDIPFLHPVLFASGLNNCVHVGILQNDLASIILKRWLEVKKPVGKSYSRYSGYNSLTKKFSLNCDPGRILGRKIIGGI